MSALPVSLALALSGALLPSGTALAYEQDPSAQVRPELNCAGQKFRDREALARRQACLESLRPEEHDRAQANREEIERLRLELREQCAQDPRTCEPVLAEKRLRDRGRDQQGEGHATHNHTFVILPGARPTRIMPWPGWLGRHGQPRAFPGQTTPPPQE